LFKKQTFIVRYAGIHFSKLLTSLSAPFLREQAVHIQDSVVAGNLFNEDNDPPSIFFEPPSDAVDAAWDAIIEQKRFLISEQDVVRLGKDPKMVVRAPDEWGMF
jgi:hypothetical protein